MREASTFKVNTKDLVQFAKVIILYLKNIVDTNEENRTKLQKPAEFDDKSIHFRGWGYSRSN